MKIYIKISLIIFLCKTETAFCQSFIFNQVYSINDFQAYNVIETSDNGFLLMGASSFINGGDYIIMKTDSSGNTEWINGGNKFDGINWSSGISSAVQIDSAYYLLGYCQPIFGSNVYMYLVKCDLFGNIIWDRYFINYFNSLGLKFESNSLVLSATTIDTVHGQYPVICRLDTSGFVINQVSISGLPDYKIVNYVIRYNKIYTVSLSGNLALNPPEYYAKINCFDSSGSVLWEYFKTDTTGFGIKGLEFDSLHLYTGINYSPDFITPGIFNSSILKFDTLGNLIWESKLDSLRNDGLGYTLSLAVSGNNSIIAVTEGLSILKSDTSSNTIWIFDSDTLGHYIIGNVIMKHEKIVVTGYYQHATGYPYRSFLKCISDSIYTSIENVFFKPIKIYPNPTVHGIYIESGELQFKASIYDLAGRLMSNVLVDKNYQYIDFSDYNSGIYILRIFSKNSILSYKIIKNNN